MTRSRTADAARRAIVFEEIMDATKNDVSFYEPLEVAGAGQFGWREGRFQSLPGRIEVMACLKVYLALATGVLVLIAGVTLPIAICKSRQRSAESAQTALRDLSQTSNGALLVDAVNYLVSRKMDGQLPGISANTRIGIDFPWLFRGTNDGAWRFINTNLGNFPIALTFTVNTVDLHQRYCYTVRKTSATNRWQLEKAWLADANDRIIKELFIHQDEPPQ